VSSPDQDDIYVRLAGPNRLLAIMTTLQVRSGPWYQSKVEEANLALTGRVQVLLTIKREKGRQNPTGTSVNGRCGGGRTRQASIRITMFVVGTRSKTHVQADVRAATSFEIDPLLGITAKIGDVSIQILSSSSLGWYLTRRGVRLLLFLFSSVRLGRRRTA
jgi:hypothetical protein